MCGVRGRTRAATRSAGPRGQGGESQPEDPARRPGRASALERLPMDRERVDDQAVHDHDRDRAGRVGPDEQEVPEAVEAGDHDAQELAEDAAPQHQDAGQDLDRTDHEVGRPERGPVAEDEVGTRVDLLLVQRDEAGEDVEHARHQQGHRREGHPSAAGQAHR